MKPPPALALAKADQALHPAREAVTRAFAAGHDVQVLHIEESADRGPGAMTILIVIRPPAKGGA